MKLTDQRILNEKIYYHVHFVDGILTLMTIKNKLATLAEFHSFATIL